MSSGSTSRRARRVQLPLAELAPAGYVLVVKAAPDGAAARRDIRFTVR